jgi:hypothetical protein
MVDSTARREHSMAELMRAIKAENFSGSIPAAPQIQSRSGLRVDNSIF